MSAALLERYLAATVFKAFLAAAAGLTVLLSLLDFTDQLGAVGHGTYRLHDAFIYILLTAPSRFIELAPIAMLVACLLGLGGLARHSELTAMRSLGFSEGRIFLSLAALAAPILLVLFLLAQYVVPPAEQAAEIRHDKSQTAPSTGGFWVQNRGEYLNVQGLGPQGEPRGVDIYDFAQDGSLIRAIHAARAKVQPGGDWLLSGVTLHRVTGSGFVTTRPDRLIWPSFITVRQLRRLLLPPQLMPPVALYHYVQELRRSHQPAIRYRNALWAQISIPVALIAMILAAIPFVLAPPRAQSAGQQIATAGVIGIVFSLCQQIAGYLTLLYGLQPALAELAPSAALMAGSIFLLRPAR